MADMKPKTVVTLTIESIARADAEVPADNRLRRLLKAILSYGFKVRSCRDVKPTIALPDNGPDTAA